MLKNEIKDSWSLVAFSNMFEKVKLATLHNGENGQEFKSLACINGDKVTFVNFSKKLGELTGSEIKSQKAGLQVVKCLGDDGETRYYLSRKGEDAWEELDL